MDERPQTSAPAEEKPKKRKKHPWLWVLLAVTILALGAWDGDRLGLWTILPTPTPVPVTPAPTAAPTPTPAPLFAARAGYLHCRDGMFYPDVPLTRGEAAEILRAAGRTVEDVTDPAAPVTEEELLALTAAASAPEAAADAMDAIRGLGDETVTRAEAAVYFNRLFGLSPAQEERSYFPDVSPDSFAWADIQTAGESGYCWPAENGRAEPGYMQLDGYLYLVDGDGYVVKNSYAGSLRFGPDGRYTSGSRELDDLVAAMLRQVTVDTMTREEMLRAAYLYVRDTFSYLTRHYYRIGDAGWATQEALTMYATGKGNCYCYAAAFWAAARQLGYQAKIVSGTYGKERAPHGWVEIFQEDGSRLTYDVEIEMVMLSKNERGGNMYALTDYVRAAHGYVEQYIKDDLIPRATNEGMLPS